MPSHGLESLPEYNGHPFDIIDGNMPAFSSADFATELGYERYSELDELGRCGTAFALANVETE